MVAAIEQGKIPPTLGFQTPNPHIDFQKAKARVLKRVEPWPKNKLKRASVTSAGFGGTNGHCIVDHVHNVLPTYLKPGVLGQRVQKFDDTNGHKNADGINGTNGHAHGNGLSSEHANGTNGHSNATNGNIGTNGSKGTPALPNNHYPVVSTPAMIRKADAATRKLVVLPFSAHNQNSLEANVDNLSRALHQHSLADVAYTLAAKRSRSTQRTYCIVDKDSISETGLRQMTDLKISSSTRRVSVGFIFTGQGAQWHAMGASLFEYAVFQESILYLDAILSMLSERATWKIADILSGNCEKDLIQTPAVSQTVCTAVQIGLVDLLASWAVRPSGVAGHHLVKWPQPMHLVA